MQTRTKIILAVIITAVTTFVITVLGGLYLLVHTFGDVLSSSVYGKLFAMETMLDTNYLYEYDKNAAMENALTAYVDSIDEPYTEYYSPEVFSSYLNNIQESYVGIGIIVSVDDNNRIVIIAPFEDSPAYNAGILPGDILTAVEGVEYDGSNLDEAIRIIKGGKIGTTVNITVLRNEKEKIDIAVERDEISDNSVKTEMLEDNIGYMRITGFNMSSDDNEKSTHTEFDKKLTELREKGANRLIIDLRDNPGGVVDEACAVADKFLPEGLIAYTEDKNGNRMDYTSDAEYTDIPIVIIINGNSASAAELFTGALKDYGRALVIGEKSYGKGIVQAVYSFADGAGMSMTTAKYYTPNGICIHEKGIDPDIVVEPRKEDKEKSAAMLEHNTDAQLQKAIEAVKER
ncbi:MAG: S41 family peptidase [Clostridia bacterium]|nr:S41 family peptidase [Clostridia bacterium]